MRGIRLSTLAIVNGLRRPAARGADRCEQGDMNRELQAGIPEVLTSRQRRIASRGRTAERVEFSRFCKPSRGERRGPDLRRGLSQTALLSARQLSLFTSTVFLAIFTTSVSCLTCNCKGNDTCDSSNRFCTNGCAPGWFGAGCQVGNMAYKKNVTQSSTSSPGSSQNKAENAIDGSNDTFSQTSSSLFPWWYVTLSQEEDIVITNVTVITNTVSGFRPGYWLILYTTDAGRSPPHPSNWTLFAYEINLTTANWSFEPATEEIAVGKRVAIYLNGTSNATLKLFEVYVYGFPLSVRPAINATWTLEQTCNTIQIMATSLTSINLWPSAFYLSGNTTEGIEITEQIKIDSNSTGLTLVASATSNRTYQLWITPEICLSDITLEQPVANLSNHKQCLQGSRIALGNVSTSGLIYEAWTNGSCLLVSAKSPSQKSCDLPILLKVRCGNDSLSSRFTLDGIAMLCNFTDARTCEVNVTQRNNVVEVNVVRNISREPTASIGNYNASATCDYINIQLGNPLGSASNLILIFVNDSGKIQIASKCVKYNESRFLNFSIAVDTNRSYAVWVSRLLCLPNCSGLHEVNNCTFSPETNCIEIAKSNVTQVTTRSRVYESLSNRSCVLMQVKPEPLCENVDLVMLQCGQMNSSVKVTQANTTVFCGFPESVADNCSVFITTAKGHTKVNSIAFSAVLPYLSEKLWNVTPTCDFIKVSLTIIDNKRPIYARMRTGESELLGSAWTNYTELSVRGVNLSLTTEAVKVQLTIAQCIENFSCDRNNTQQCMLSESCLTAESSKEASVIPAEHREYETWTNASCVFARLSSTSSQQCKQPTQLSISCTNALDAVVTNGSVIASLCNLLPEISYDCLIIAVISDKFTERHSKRVIIESLRKTTITPGQIAGAAIGSFIFATLFAIFICILFRRYSIGRKQENDVAQSMCDPHTIMCNGYGTRPTKSGSEVEELTTADNVQGMSLPEFFDYAQKDELICLKYEKHVPSSSLSCEVGRAEINKAKNKFQNIVPYDANRVILNRKNDYINASFINGYFKEKKYIATQGPTLNTIGDFWLMVWQQNISTIVMLTDFVENSKRKCEPYFPAACSGGSLVQVKIRSQKTFDCHAVTVLDVEMNRESRPVTHYHMLTWKDHDIPDHCAELVIFYSQIQDLTMQSSSINLPTVVVHCSAGAGRTGTLIAFDWLQHCAKVEKRIDVDGCVKALRAQRMQAVQTKEQYLFLHKALLYGIRTLKFTFNADFLNAYVDKLSQHTTSTFALDEEWQILNDCRNNVRHLYEAANKPENRHKNRTPDILASDSKRVFLQGEVESHCDYINAVYCNGCYSDKGFVVSQIPLQSTVNDFWKMVYDIQASCIVLMHHIPEDEDCAQYYPHCGQSMTCGRFAILNDSPAEDKRYGDYETFNLLISDSLISSKNEVCEIKVKLFVLTTWKLDEATPKSSGSVLALLTELRPHCQDSSRRPIIVQCRDGASHSGMFVCAANAFHRLIETNQVQVFHSVDLARSSRPEFISSTEQYRFIYFMLLQHNDSSAVYANA